MEALVLEAFTVSTKKAQKSPYRVMVEKMNLGIILHGSQKSNNFTKTERKLNNIFYLRRCELDPRLNYPTEQRSEAESCQWFMFCRDNTK